MKKFLFFITKIILKNSRIIKNIMGIIHVAVEESFFYFTLNNNFHFSFLLTKIKK